MFRNMPLALLVLIACVGIFHPWIPLFVQSVLYGVSLSLKSLILFVLPFLIFGLLFKTAVQLAKKASGWALFLLLAICLSNFFSTLMSYAAGTLAHTLDLTFVLPDQQDTLNPLWMLSFPKLVDNSLAMFAGLFLGMAGGWFLPAKAEKLAARFEIAIGIFLNKFLYAIPFFIIGFTIKMMHDGLLSLILQNYALIFVLVTVTVFAYIAFLYLAAGGFRYTTFLQSIQNMAPAAIAGFGSMSSAAAMPLTILGTEKNSQNPDIARSLIPATVNIHLIGDCFAIPIFAFAIMKSFGVPEPAFGTYLVFAMYFVLAKFSVAAVPGGGILVMLPILETHLGFNAEMLSLITTLYILFDPLITSANILGNGGFALLASRLVALKQKRHLATENS